MSEHCLDLWIEQVNQGDAVALGHLLLACEPYLRIAVRSRLGRRLRTTVDSMDVVQSVFARVLHGFRAGGWRFAGRRQWFAFLRRVVRGRLADRYQEHRQALDREQSLAETGPLRLPSSTSPRPSEIAQGRELWERLLRACPPAHREVVRLRAEGFRIREIASRTSLHEGSVRRILYDLARGFSVARRMNSGISRKDAKKDAKTQRRQS
jgi:RNA polymerase sigma-70 factor (ECF subfamily)